jgi:hypothetical protein
MQRSLHCRSIGQTPLTFTLMVRLRAETLKNKNNTIRTDEPTPGTLALIGDSRASLWPGSKFLAEGREISFVYFSDIVLKTEIQNFLHSAQAALSHPSLTVTRPFLRPSHRPRHPPDRGASCARAPPTRRASTQNGRCTTFCCRPYPCERRTSFLRGRDASGVVAVLEFASSD